MKTPWWKPGAGIALKRVPESRQSFCIHCVECPIPLGAMKAISNRERVIAYIQDQEKHHKKRTFEEELLAFLQSADVKYDPRYVLG